MFEIAKKSVSFYNKKPNSIRRNRTTSSNSLERTLRLYNNLYVLAKMGKVKSAEKKECQECKKLFRLPKMNQFCNKIAT